MIIDTHAHFVPPSLLADVKAQKRLFPSLKTKEEKGHLCFSFAGAEMTRPIMPLLSDVEKRRAWMVGVAVACGLATMGLLVGAPTVGRAVGADCGPLGARVLLRIITAAARTAITATPRPINAARRGSGARFEAIGPAGDSESWIPADFPCATVRSSTAGLGALAGLAGSGSGAVESSALVVAPAAARALANSSAVW